jgi:hypothetical protein
MNRIINDEFATYPNGATVYIQSNGVSRWHIDASGNVAIGGSMHWNDFDYKLHRLGYEVKLWSEKAIQSVYNFRNIRYTTFFATEEELTMMLLSLKGREVK